MATPPANLFTASLPEMYERFLVGPLFTPFAQSMLVRVGVSGDDRLLDIACGTGIVARLARERLGGRGQVVGVDASPGMLAVARSVSSTIDWREGSADALPVSGDERFDAVTCHQGLQFFPDKAAAVREMRRVLAPGGRVAIGTWRPIPEVPLFRDLHQVAERHLGLLNDQRHSFGDGDAIAGLLTDAGLGGVSAETVTHTIRMADSATFARLNSMAVVGMSPGAKAMSDDQRAAVTADLVRDSVQAMAPYVVDGTVVFSLASNIVMGRA
jgi:SAM-dependent methyltransferase